MIATSRDPDIHLPDTFTDSGGNAVGALAARCCSPMEHSGFVLFGEASCRERISIFSCAVILGVPGSRVVDHAAGWGSS
jgi:hypothetical protein